MTQPTKTSNAPAKDKPIGDRKNGGETPKRRFAEKSFPSGYEQKGDVDRPPFEGHPDQEANSGRPRHKQRHAETAGQHGQRPKKEPRSS